MYSIVLMTALATSTAAPNFCHRSHCCYSMPACSCSCSCSCYSYSSCYGGHVVGYGWAGGCYGYHGGCYGAFGNGYIDPRMPGYYGCTGCYGCYGGYSCYGVPVPLNTVPPAQRPTVDPYPPINPKRAVPEGEEIPPLKEKKAKVQESVRAKVRIEIPEGGRLFVDGQRIETAAGTRVFQTPTLAAGQTYYYDIRIEVEQNGAIRQEERRIIIHAGQDALVSFPRLRASDADTAQVNR